MLPPTRAYKLKRFLLELSEASIGHNVRIVSSARFNLTGRLSIGSDTFIGHNVSVIGGDANIDIGDNVDIAPGVMIISGSHQINPTSDRVAGPGYSSTITIGNGCWIGAGSIILGGTTLGENTVIAAGAVVKGEYPSRCIVGGIPAKVIRHL